MARFIHIGGGGIDKSFLGAYAFGNGSVVTITGVDLGAEDTAREIAVPICWIAGAVRTLVSAKIRGVTASLGGAASLSAIGARMIHAPVPAGPTGDVELTFSGPVSQGGIAVYRFVDREVAGAAPADFASASSLFGSSVSISGVDCPDAGAIITALSLNPDSAGTPSGLNVASDGGVEGAYFGSSPIQAAQSGAVGWATAGVTSLLAAAWCIK